MPAPYSTFTSAVIPLPRENVDTDQIVPARYLKVTDKAGLAEALFRDWRFDENGCFVEPLFVLVAADPGVELTVDLESQVVHLPGDEDLPFDVDPFAKLMLLRGTDELGYLLDRRPEIDAWEAMHPARVDTRPSSGGS